MLDLTMLDRPPPSLQIQARGYRPDVCGKFVRLHVCNLNSVLGKGCFAHSNREYIGQSLSLLLYIILLMLDRMLSYTATLMFSCQFIEQTFINFHTNSQKHPLSYKTILLCFVLRKTTTYIPGRSLLTSAPEQFLDL